MKPRTRSYLGTFVNSPEGESSYRLMVKNIRQVVKGGRFVKMYRHNPSNPKKWPCGTLRKEGSSHFDVYLHSRVIVKGNKFSWSHPRFYGWVLQ